LFYHDHPQAAFESLMIEYCGQQNGAVGALMALKDFGAQILPIDFAIVDFWSPPPCSLLSGVELSITHKSERLMNTCFQKPP